MPQLSYGAQQLYAETFLGEVFPEKPNIYDLPIGSSGES